MVRLIQQKAKGKDVVYCQNSEIVPPHLREGRENLGHYLAGLIEGDGSIIVPRTSSSLPPSAPIAPIGCGGGGGNEKGKLYLNYKCKLTNLEKLNYVFISFLAFIFL